VIADVYRHRSPDRGRKGAWQPRSRRRGSARNATGPEVIDQSGPAAKRSWPRQPALTSSRDELLVLAAAREPAGHGGGPVAATINRILSRTGCWPQTEETAEEVVRRFPMPDPEIATRSTATEVVLAVPARRSWLRRPRNDCTRTLVACRAAPAETTKAAIEAMTAARDQYRRAGDRAVRQRRCVHRPPPRPQRRPHGFARTLTSWRTRLIHPAPTTRKTCGSRTPNHRPSRMAAHQPSNPHPRRPCKPC